MEAPFKAVPYDASDFDSIAFWARVGDVATADIRIHLGGEYRRPEGGHCEVDEEESAHGMKCFDNFSVQLNERSTDWKY